MNKKGFTMLELILNLFLVSFVLLSLSPIISNSLIKINNSYRKNEMTDILNNIFQYHISYRETKIESEIYGLRASDLSKSNLKKEIKKGNVSYYLKWEIESFNEKINVYVGEIYDEKNSIRWKVYSR